MQWLTSSKAVSVILLDTMILAAAVRFCGLLLFIILVYFYLYTFIVPLVIRVDSELLFLLIRLGLFVSVP